MAATTPNMGLREWNAGTDPFSYTELFANWDKVDAHDHTTGKGVQIPSGGIANLAVTNGKLATDAVDASKILDGSVGANELAANAVTTSKILNANVTGDKLIDAVKVGISDSTSVRRGKCITPTTDSRTNTVYGLMAAPDRVQNIVLSTDGLIVVGYQALYQQSVANAGKAAIFIGASQLQGSTNGGVVAQEAGTSAITASDIGLATSSDGLHMGPSGGVVDVTTGQILGVTDTTNKFACGPCYIFAAAGTYDISVQFKSTSGSVTVKNRKLWVWTLGF